MSFWCYSVDFHEPSAEVALTQEKKTKNRKHDLVFNFIHSVNNKATDGNWNEWSDQPNLVRQDGTKINSWAHFLFPCPLNQLYALVGPFLHKHRQFINWLVLDSRDPFLAMILANKQPSSNGFSTGEENPEN